MLDDGDRKDKPGKRRARLPTSGLFDLVPSVISIHDLNFRIRQINQSFRSLFGDRLGEYCYRVYKYRSDPCPDCPVQKTFNDGQSHHSEMTVRSKSGDQYHVLIWTAPIWVALK